MLKISLPLLVLLQIAFWRSTEAQGTGGLPYTTRLCVDPDHGTDNTWF
jgi:hypothetical protein